MDMGLRMGILGSGISMGKGMIIVSLCKVVKLSLGMGVECLLAS